MTVLKVKDGLLPVMQHNVSKASVPIQLTNFGPDALQVWQGANGSGGPLGTPLAVGDTLIYVVTAEQASVAAAKPNHQGSVVFELILR